MMYHELGNSSIETIGVFFDLISDNSFDRAKIPEIIF